MHVFARFGSRVFFPVNLFFSVAGVHVHKSQLLNEKHDLFHGI